jgi:hypothetical protein
MSPAPGDDALGHLEGHNIVNSKTAVYYKHGSNAFIYLRMRPEIQSTFRLRSIVRASAEY